MLTKSDLSQIEKIFNPVIDDVASLKKNLKTVEKSLTGKISGIHEKMNSMHKEVSGVYQEISDIHGEINGLHKEVSSMHGEINGMREEHVEYKDEVLTKLDDISGQLENLNEDKVLSFHQTSQLEKKVEDHEVRIGDLEKIQQIV